jgi:gamma-glutamyltranspeptidase/glutathione hydrolase
MQPQGHVQFLLAQLEFGLDIQQAADVPRFYHHAWRLLLAEYGMPAHTRSALRGLGHLVFPAGPRYFGGAQAVRIHPETGVYLGASDPRKDGAALGY